TTSIPGKICELDYKKTHPNAASPAFVNYWKEKSKNKAFKQSYAYKMQELLQKLKQYQAGKSWKTKKKAATAPSTH
ncbi:hypothetical protein VKT23_013665, partial [Stygiomarasmius scandens]